MTWPPVDRLYNIRDLSAPKLPLETDLTYHHIVWILDDVEVPLVHALTAQKEQVCRPVSRDTSHDARVAPLKVDAISLDPPSSLHLLTASLFATMTQGTPSSSGLRRRTSNGDNRSKTPPRPTERRPISPTTFYGTDSSLRKPGSSHTAYIPPDNFESYREPELIEDTTRNSTWDQWGGGTTNDWGDVNDYAANAASWGEPSVIRKIPIDGRDEEEELRWYDADLRAQKRRPGPGVLPPLLADMLHDPDHALYSVSTQPHPPLATPAPPHAPTADEVRTAIPHPNAYYCREHNGWVLLLWRSSTVLPPLVKDPEIPLPDQARRKTTTSCVGDGEQPFGQVNVTHHWHRYEKAVDATKLNPPYSHGDLLLDLYLCCQCSTYCLVSDIIPGVIPLPLMDEFTREKLANPAPDKSPRATAVAAWETVLT